MCPIRHVPHNRLITSQGTFIVCTVDISRFKKKINRHHITYPDIPLSIARVPYFVELSGPIPPEKDLVSEGGKFEYESEESYITQISAEKKQQIYLYPNSQALDDFI